MCESKNLNGGKQDFGNCPNCGDSWSWKKAGYLTYEGKLGITDFELGVMICTVCLDKPDALDAEHIASELKVLDWNTDVIVKVRAAIVNFQTSKAT